MGHEISRRDFLNGVALTAAAALTPLAGFTARTKAVFGLNTTAAIGGLGYLIGVRYAAYIMAGSVFSYFLVVPLFAYLGGNVAHPTGGAGYIEVPGALYLLGAPMASRTVTPYVYVRVVRGAGTITPRIVDGAGAAVSTSGSASSSTAGEYFTLPTFTPEAGKTYRLQISMSVATDLGATEGYLYAA